MILQFSSSAEGVGKPWPAGALGVWVCACWCLLQCWVTYPLIALHCCGGAFRGAMAASSQGLPVQGMPARARRWPQPPAAPPPLTGEKRINRLVFIGKNLDRKELEDGFKSCLT